MNTTTFKQEMQTPNIEKFLFNDENSKESCILDCNKGEKLIIELNNHICLGEYELARTFFKQIIDICPIYLEYFYRILFIRGIPDKWLLSNQIRTTANYLWLLYCDYINELCIIPNCPQIQFTDCFVKSMELDLVLTTAFYYSYECLNNFEIKLEFLGELRIIYNYFLYLSLNIPFGLKKLRLLSPDNNLPVIYLELEETYFDSKDTYNFESFNQNWFIGALKNLILTQPILSKNILNKIIFLFQGLDDKKHKEIKKFKEIILEIFFEIITMFLYFKDFKNIYEYLKLIPNLNFDNDFTPGDINKTIEIVKEKKSGLIYVILLFSTLVSITNSPEKKLVDAYGFIVYCLEKFNFTTSSLPTRIEKILTQFNGENNPYKEIGDKLDKLNKTNIKKDLFLQNKVFEFKLDYNSDNSSLNDADNFLLKHKIHEALLANSNNCLLHLLQIIEDNFIKYQFEREKTPYFFQVYNSNLDFNQINCNYFEYNELKYLLLSVSKDNNHNSIDNNSIVSLWNTANNTRFWNNYINFLRVNNEHFLGYSLKQAIKFVFMEDFNNGVIFLHPLNNLKLLLILIVWERFNGDIISQQQLLQVFWKSYLQLKNNNSNEFGFSEFTLVPLFEDTITNLEYLINFTLWIENKLSVLINSNTINQIVRKLSSKESKEGLLNTELGIIYYILSECNMNNNTKPRNLKTINIGESMNNQVNKTISSQIYNELLSKSYPKVLSYFLKYLSFKEITDYSLSCFPSTNKELQRTHFHSTMIIFSSYVYLSFLSKIEEYFYPTVINVLPSNIFSREEKDNLRNILNKIILFPYRLNIMGDIFNLIFLKFKDFIYNGLKNDQFINDNESRISTTLLDHENSDDANKNPYHVNPYYLYQKRIFKDMCIFLIEIIQPIKNFDFKNLNKMFDKEFLSLDVSKTLEQILASSAKELFILDLVEIDQDFIMNKDLFKTNICNNNDLESDNNMNNLINYKSYLENKTKDLLQNVNELIFRFNIINNPWLEIIQDALENYAFLPTVLQNSLHYLQIAKKFHMWKTASDIIDFFSLSKNNNEIKNNPSSINDKNHQRKEFLNENQIFEIKMLKFFTDKKLELGFTDGKTMTETEISDYISNLLNNRELKLLLLLKLGIKVKLNNTNQLESLDNASCLDNLNLNEFEKSKLNFEYFKFFYDISLSENISPNLSKSLLIKAKEILDECNEDSTITKNIKDVIVRFDTILQTNSDSDECLSKVIVSIKNLGSVQISEPSLYRDKLIEQLSRQNSLISLFRNVNNKNADHKELSQYFDEALKSLEKTEMESMFGKYNYLKRFLEYVMKIGNIYYEAKTSNNPNSTTNYLRVMQKYPKEIIANLFLKYNSENEALLVATMTKTNLISVILEFTEYFKKEIIYTTDFNNMFQALIENVPKLTSLIQVNNNTAINLTNTSNNNNENIVSNKNSIFNNNQKLNKLAQGNFKLFNKNNNNTNLDNLIDQNLTSNKISKTNESNFSNKVNLNTGFSQIKEIDEYVKGINVTFPVTMRILEFIYKLYFNENSNYYDKLKNLPLNYELEYNNKFTKYFPLFISFYRFDYDQLNEEEQFKFWELLINKYAGDDVFKNYITLIFKKFYFYKTFYKRNQKFSELYYKLMNPNNKDSIENSVNFTNSSSVNTNKTKELVKNLILSEKNNTLHVDKNDSLNVTNQNLCNAFSNKSNKDVYIDLKEKISNKEHFSKMLPKNFSFIPKAEEQNLKISQKLNSYLDSKINNNQHTAYSKFIINTSNNSSSNKNTIYNKDEIKLNLTLKNNNTNTAFNPKFKDLINISYQNNLKYYEELCINLTTNKQYELALEIANKHLESSNSDVVQNLIIEIVKVTDNEEKLIKLLLRMKNKKLVFDIVEKHWFLWKPQSSLVILYLIDEEASVFEQTKKKKIGLLIKKLEVFSSILERSILTNLNNLTLEQLEQNCENEIKLEWVLNELMNNNSHDLCYQLLLVLNKYDQYKNIVKYSQIKLLLSSDNMDKKILALEKLKGAENKKIDFCLDLLKDLQNYQNKLLIINYLLENHRTQLSDKIFNYLIKLKTSIKVFFLLPKDIQVSVVHLIDFPELVLETLLINEKFKIIKTIINYFPNLLDEKRIAFYCYKAMTISNFEGMSNTIHSFNNTSTEIVQITNTNTSNNYNINNANNINGSNMKSNETVKIVINQENCESIRNNYQFKNSPDLDLFRNFTDLCEKITTISNICFEVCNNCSKYLKSNFPSNLKILLLNLIDKVLDYLKEKLEKTHFYSDDHSIVNEKLVIYKKLTLMFRKFVLKGIDSLVDLELQKFYSNKGYLIKIRDILIDNDYLNLANEYCNELEIDPSRVDLELGLFCLKNRKFSEAREFFEKILGKKLFFSSNNNNNSVINSNNKNTNGTSTTNNNANLNKNVSVTEQIISILQGSFNLKISEINRIHQFLLFRFSNKLTTAINGKPDISVLLLQRHKEAKLKSLVKEQSSIEINRSLESVYNNNNNTNSNSENFELENYFDVILLDKYLSNEKEVIIKETLYYIQKYGSEEQMLKFFVNNGMSKETVNFTIKNQISLVVFKEQILKKCKKEMIFYITLELKRKTYSANSNSNNGKSGKGDSREIRDSKEFSKLGNKEIKDNDDSSNNNSKNSSVIGKLSKAKTEENLNLNNNNFGNFNTVNNNNSKTSTQNKSYYDVHDYINELLTEIIVFFLETNAVNDLIRWFIMMEDYITACFYSLNAAFKSVVFNEKLEFLSNAAENISKYIDLIEKEQTPKKYYIINSRIKKYQNFELTLNTNNSYLYFNKYYYIQNHNLNENNSSRHSNNFSYSNMEESEKIEKEIHLEIKLDRQSLKTLYRTILLQIKVLSANPSCCWILLSNDNNEKQKTFEDILILNSDLAYEIIQEYSVIDFFHAFMDCTRRYVIEKDYKSFESLLEILSTWNLTGKLNRFDIQFDNTWNELIKYAITTSLVNSDYAYIESNLLPLLTNTNDRSYVLISLGKLIEAIDNADSTLPNYNQIIQEIKIKAEKDGLNDVLDYLYITNS